MKITATLAGSYPRREDLVKATWNKDKGLVGEAELESNRTHARQELVDLQRRLGFAPLVDGLLGWQDLFRPLVEASAGFEVGGVTRLFETNRFYRRPTLQGPPRLDWAKLRPAFPSDKELQAESWKAILPSPYWFTRATLDHHFHDEANLGGALARLVNEAAKRLEAVGVKQIQFNEPALFYEKNPDIGFANELLGAATKGLRTSTVANFPNGDAAPHHGFLQTVPVDVIGIDFVETLPAKLHPRLEGKKILAQIVNAQESHLESPADLQTLVQGIVKRAKPAELSLTHTWDLEFVPHEVAVRKLQALSGLLQPREVTA